MNEPTQPPKKSVNMRRIIACAVLAIGAGIVGALAIGLFVSAAYQAPSAKDLWALALLIALVTSSVLFVLSRNQTRWNNLFSWKTARRALAGVIIVITLVAVFYAVENFRGARAWDQERKAQEAKGAILDLSAFVPPRVPDDQNFAATPLIKSWFVKTTNGYGGDWNDSYSVADIPDHVKGERQFTDLGAWAAAFDAIASGDYFEKSDDPARRVPKKNQKFESARVDRESRQTAAPAVLRGLATNDAIFAELRAASSRPHSVYPVYYDLNNPWGILLPHLAKVKGTCARLQLKACAELALGKTDAALDDILLICSLMDSLKEESFLISYLVRAVILQSAIQPIWEGLAEKRWNERQLQIITDRVQKFNFLQAAERPFNGERAAGVLTCDLLYRRVYKFSELLSYSQNAEPAATLLSGLGVIAPHGWFRLEQANYCRLFEQQLSGAFDLEKHRVYPARIVVHNDDEHLFALVRQEHPIKTFLQHKWISAMLLPSLGNFIHKASYVETLCNEASTACSLEQYRLSHGEFPDALQKLPPSPRLLDIITGNPLIYRRMDHSFVLYSVAWNEKDDGAVLDPKKDSRDTDQPDWVWKYPGATESPLPSK